LGTATALVAAADALMLRVASRFMVAQIFNLLYRRLAVGLFSSPATALIRGNAT